MPPTITVAIPTYNRDRVLVDTLEQLLSLRHRADEILVIDQTPRHDDETETALTRLQDRGEIEWIRLAKPSITRAMNTALLRARSDLVLFLDDDVELTSDIVAEHARCYEDESVHAVVGQVIQPWQQPLPLDAPFFPEGQEANPDAFRFNASRRCRVQRVMAGNLSVRRDLAIAVGGFDENFVQVAYRFEAEFADRLTANGHGILFEPRASLKHLKASGGGTRSFGQLLTTIRPSHAVGKYYYLYSARNVYHRWIRIITGPLRAIATRFHLRHPWWIPGSVIAEITGMLWAIGLRLHGPRLLNAGKIE